MLKPWIQLIRPSNVLTAISDVLAGVALACLFLNVDLPAQSNLLLITLSSMLLYTGGIVLNDVFDAKLDATERPERPIPSGKVKQASAAWLVGIAFLAGCILAYAINTSAFAIAVGITFIQWYSQASLYCRAYYDGDLPRTKSIAWNGCYSCGVRPLVYRRDTHYLHRRGY
mgnify:CR=1 FL=1